MRANEEARAEALLAEARRLYPNVVLLRKASIGRALSHLAQLDDSMSAGRLNNFVPCMTICAPPLVGPY
ncbi:hypothetical protein MBH78_20180 [Oceanimonas sp. NS1]|nr:hypothetical protein [Oceanimonas sp. NS1]